MRYNKFIKAITLLGFAILMTGFLLYRTGKLETLLPKPTAAHSNPVQKDTIVPARDSTRPLFIPSSKSLVLTDKNAGFLDSILKKSGTRPAFKSKRDAMLMSSSKSGIIIPAEKGVHFSWDSLRLDSSKKTMQKKQ